MSRWKQQDATVCIFGTVNCAFGENASDARRIVTEHNTDCDAYEEKIAELESRLVSRSEAMRRAEMEEIDANAESDELRARIAELESEKDMLTRVYADACAEVQQRDKVIAKILALLEPKGASPYENGQAIAGPSECDEWDIRATLNARATKIAKGETE